MSMVRLIPTGRLTDDGILLVHRRGVVPDMTACGEYLKRLSYVEGRGSSPYLCLRCFPLKDCK